jgi:molybdopterin adenylyltransferase
MALEAKVITVSDSAARGEREDLSGPALSALLGRAGFVVVHQQVIPDGIESVREPLEQATQGFAGLVVTTGGTGFSPRDVTPEATAMVIDRAAPGLAESMRAVNPLGRLSRGVCGTRGTAIVCNLPGSQKGSLEMLDSVLDVLPHALILAAGGDPGH